MGFQLLAAATRTDWLSLFTSLPNSLAVRFYPFGRHTSREIPSFHLEEIPHLSVSSSGILVTDDDYLVLADDAKLHCTETLMPNGDVHFFVDQRLNADSFVFRPGGAFSDKYFIIGEVSTLYSEGEAVTFARRMVSKARRSFGREAGFIVGGDCLAMHGADRLFTVDYRSGGKRLSGSCR